MQNKFITYSLIFFLIIPFFGFHFLISLLGNILLLVILIPILVLGLGLLGLNLFKSNINLCENCGSAIIGNNSNCPNCGYQIMQDNIKDDDFLSDASNKTIEIKAEEIN